jgi:hypothetical protein
MNVFHVNGVLSTVIVAGDPATRGVGLMNGGVEADAELPASRTAREAAMATVFFIANSFSWEVRKRWGYATSATVIWALE